MKYFFKQLLLILVMSFTSLAHAQEYIKNIEPSPNGSLIITPAQIGLVNASRLDTYAGGFAAQEKSTDTENQSVDVKGTKIFLNTIFKSSPSIYWAANIVKYNRYTRSKIAAFESKSSLTQWEFQLSAAFKILDSLILGAEYGIHKRTRNPGTPYEMSYSPNQTSLGMLFKANIWEFGVGFKKITEDDDSYLQYAVHTRTLINATNALAAYLIKFPQESCCNLSTATRYEIGAGYQFLFLDDSFEMTIAQRPAFEDGIEAEISKNILTGLWEFGGQAFSRFGVKSEYSWGQGKLRTRQVKYERITGYLTYALPL